MSPVPDSLAVRDSKHAAGPRLGFAVTSWTAFVTALAQPGQGPAAR